MSIQWNAPPHARPGEEYVDVSGVGRYLVRRERPGGRLWRAFLNGKRTTFAGSREDAKAMVERTIRMLPKQGEKQ